MIKLLVQIRTAASQGVSGISEGLLEEIDRYLDRFSTDAVCSRCGKQLFLSDLPQYAYVCYDCDENFLPLSPTKGRNCHERNETTHE